MPTVQQLAAELNSGIIDGLIKNARAVPADKLAWKPLDLGRSVLNQIAECAVITKWVIKLIESRDVPELSNEGYADSVAALEDVNAAVAALESAKVELKSVIETFPSEHLDDQVTLPFFPDPMTFAAIFYIPYWNNTYHIGQICYIQTLLGDTTSH
ncbi:MAG: DinB family protein [Chthonomonadales bacterium]